MVESLLRTLDSGISYKGVRATSGKRVRAEPVAALYEQGRVFHVRPFPELERQLCSYVPGKNAYSPDRLDALVWGISELLMGRHNPIAIWGHYNF